MATVTYAEIFKLNVMLTAAEIPHDIHTRLGGFQILYPGRGDWVCSVICFPGSYGFEEGLLEIMGLVDHEVTRDSVQGHLTAEDVFERIAADYKQRQSEANQ